jgi:Flp pilus assembly protein TadD
MEVYPLGVRIANALVSYIAYLWKMIWPQGLAVYYPHPINTLPLWQSVGSAIILVFISLFVVITRRTKPYMLVGWLWYIITLIPVIGLVQVGGQAMADRYTYIPLIGIFIMIIWGVFDLAQKHRTVIAVCATFVLMAMVACTHIQSGCWRDGVTLFEHTLRWTRPNHVSHMNLAVCLDRQGRYSEAIIHFRKALRLRPNTPEIHYNMAITLMNLGRPDDAISHYREAVRLNPRYAEAHYNLGLALDEKGMPRAAIRHYEQALRVQPDFVQARNNLAVAYYSIGDYARAWNEVQRVRKYGFEPHPDFIAALKQCLPEPQSEE